MGGIASQPRGIARLARNLGLDCNPLRRSSDRAEAWIRVGLVAIFLIAGPVAALAAGHWAYHAEITRILVQAERTHQVKAVPLQSALATVDPARANESRLVDIETLRESAGSARADEVLAAITAVALVAIALLTALRVTVTFLNRLRLAAWETAWSRVGPQWTGGRS